MSFSVIHNNGPGWERWSGWPIYWCVMLKFDDTWGYQWEDKLCINGAQGYALCKKGTL